MANKKSLFDNVVVQNDEEKTNIMLQMILDIQEQFRQTQNDILSKLTHMSSRIQKLESLCATNFEEIIPKLERVERSSRNSEYLRKCAAAHSINNGRKVHGVASFEDPVSQFHRCWHKDHPIPRNSQKPTPLMNPILDGNQPKMAFSAPSPFGYGIYQNPFQQSLIRSSQSTTRPTTPNGNYQPSIPSQSRPVPPLNDYREQRDYRNGYVDCLRNSQNSHENGTSRWNPYQQKNHESRMNASREVECPIEAYLSSLGGNGIPKSPPFSTSTSPRSKLFNQQQPKITPQVFTPLRDSPSWPESPNYD